MRIKECNYILPVRQGFFLVTLEIGLFLYLQSSFLAVTVINRKKPEGSKIYWTVINWILITKVSLIKNYIFTDLSLKDNNFIDFFTECFGELENEFSNVP